MRSRNKDTKSPNAPPSVSRNDELANFMFSCVLAVQKKWITGCRRMCCEGKICVEEKGLQWLRTADYIWR